MKRSYSKIGIIIAWAILAFLPLQTQATTLVERGFEEQIQRAGIIFEGQVLSKYCAYSDDRQTIYTFVTFQKKSVFKGAISTPTLELRFEGGSVDDETVKVIGMPEFETGEQVILFLRPEISPIKTSSPVLGFEEGKFTIKKERDGVERVFGVSESKIVGYDETEDRLESVFIQKQKKRMPVAHNPEQDKLVEHLSPKESLPSIARDQFLGMINSFVKKHGLIGSEFKALSSNEKLQSIHMVPVPAPRVKESAVKK